MFLAEFCALKKNPPYTSHRKCPFGTLQGDFVIKLSFLQVISAKKTPLYLLARENGYFVALKATL